MQSAARFTSALALPMAIEKPALRNMRRSFSMSPSTAIDSGATASRRDRKSSTVVQAGRIAEVAQYCEGDVLNTYRLWLIYELFRGGVTAEQLGFSETQAAEFVRARKFDNPHLAASVSSTSDSSNDAGRQSVPYLTGSHDHVELDL